MASLGISLGISSETLGFGFLKKGRLLAAAPLWAAVALLSMLASSPHANAQTLQSGQMPSELQDLQRVLQSYGATPTITSLPSAQSPDVIDDQAGALDARRYGASQAFYEESQRRELARDRSIAIRAWCSGEDRIDPDLIEDFSRLEQDYCRRVGVYVPQYGYDLFAERPELNARPEGAIAEDYVLGIGDQIIVTYRGSETGTYTVSVDREGRVVLPDLPPVAAAGLRLGDFRRDLEEIASEALIGANIYVSVGELRTISVLVAGEVERPGAVRLMALSTVLDVLADAGVKKTGSLRRLRVERGANSYQFDLYAFLEFGNAGGRIDIADGDRVIVPIIGSTLAVSGAVQRPGIYELADTSSDFSVRSALKLAGGTLRPQGNSVERLRIDALGRHVREELDDQEANITAGDLVLVEQLNQGATNAVTLSGHVLRPGIRSVASASSLSELLIDARSMKNDAYLPFAVLRTRDPASRVIIQVPVNLMAIFSDGEDLKLHDGDELLVFSNSEIAYLDSLAVRHVLEGQELIDFEPKNQIAAEIAAEDVPIELRKAICPALIALQNTVSDGTAARFVTALQSEPTPWIGECPEVFVEHPEVLAFLLEHVAVLIGEVRQPGLYPTVEGASASGVVMAAGGLSREIDQSAIDLSRQTVDRLTGERGIVRQRYRVEGGQIAELSIEPGDIVRFNSLIADREGTIELSGEFMRPGRYEIRRGERLSEVIVRAGGVTEAAFPYGAVFTRVTAQAVERMGFERAARDLEASLASAVAKNVDADADAVEAILSLSTQLRQVDAVGRVVVEADPTVLQVRRDLDMILEPGDRLHIPKRPGYVTVVGDVLNPGSQQFTPGSRSAEYIARTGGLQASADKSHIFVVYPNGAANSVSLSAWNYSSEPVPPGSVIVVPRDADPFDAMQLTLDLTQIFSQIALSAAALAVIN